jgi:hypothetical protein
MRSSTAELCAKLTGIPAGALASLVHELIDERSDGTRRSPRGAIERLALDCTAVLGSQIAVFSTSMRR